MDKAAAAAAATCGGSCVLPARDKWPVSTCNRTRYVDGIITRNGSCVVKINFLSFKGTESLWIVRGGGGGGQEPRYEKYTLTDKWNVKEVFSFSGF